MSEIPPPEGPPDPFEVKRDFLLARIAKLRNHARANDPIVQEQFSVIAEILQEGDNQRILDAVAASLTRIEGDYGT